MGEDGSDTDGGLAVEATWPSAGDATTPAAASAHRQGIASAMSIPPQGRAAEASRRAKSTAHKRLRHGRAGGFIEFTRPQTSARRLTWAPPGRVPRLAPRLGR
jgi:hypothetical protein